MSEPRWQAPTKDAAALRASPFWGVHASRYLFAAPQVRGREVLDVACGTGFGIDLLLDAGARRVVGVDLDPQAVRQAARGARSCPGRYVVQAECGQLPFAAASFGVVTSFETLEHLVDRPAFLAELRRVLAPDGLLLLSTPNAKVTQPQNGTPANPYHVHEYTPEELVEEVQSHFPSVELLGQRLHPRFSVPPFWDEQQRLPRTASARFKLMTWRVLNKLPAAFRNPVSRAVLAQPFVPDSSDYLFTPERIETAPVLLILCRGL